MIFCGERKGGWLAPFFHFEIIRIALAVGHRHIGDVRDGEHQLLPFDHYLLQPLFGFGHALLQVLHLLNNLLPLMILQDLYFVAPAILLRALRVKFLSDLFALVVNRDKPVEVDLDMLLRGARFDDLRILPNKMYVKHVLNSILHLWRYENWSGVNGRNSSSRYPSRRRGCGYGEHCQQKGRSCSRSWAAAR